MFLKVKENSRQQGFSTKGELSQLAVLLHELVLQVLLYLIHLVSRFLGRGSLPIGILLHYSGARLFSTRYFGNRYFCARHLAAQNQLVLLQEIERLLAEETINELRRASGGMVPPLLLDVAYIEVLPRDHLTRVEEREVKVFLESFVQYFPSKFVLLGTNTGRGEKDPIS